MVIIMGAAAVAPALDPIGKHFPDASAYVISLVITLPALSVAITGFGVGYLADRFGKAKVLFISLAIFSIAGVSGYFSTSLEMLLAGRFILGIGIAGISLTVTALIGEYWVGIDRGKIIAYQSAAIGIGALILEGAGGMLADIGWKEPFFIYLIAAPILIIGLFSIREPHRIAHTMDIEVPEIRIPHRGRRIALCYAMIFAGMFLMFSLPTNLSLYVSEIGEDFLICGLLLGVMGTAQAGFSLVYSRVVDKPKDGFAYASAFLLLCIGFLLFFSPNLILMFIGMILIGSGLGIITMVVIGSLSYMSVAHNSGKIMGGYSVAMNLAFFTSAIVSTSILTLMNDSFSDTFVLLGAVAGMICVACFIGGYVSGRTKTTV
jgi:MFS family permease